MPGAEVFIQFADTDECPFVDRYYKGDMLTESFCGNGWEEEAFETLEGEARSESATIPDFLTRPGNQSTATQEVISIVKNQSEDDGDWKRDDCDGREGWVASTPADTDMCVCQSPFGWLYLVRLGDLAATRQEAQEAAEKLAKEIEQMRAAE
jgi:hypothetical protein